MAGSGVFQYPAFVRLWLSDTVKWLGLFTSNLALQLLLIETLQADQADLGLVRSAQWLPSLLFGMLVGVLVDRVRRRPVLIAGDTICAVVFATIGVLALLGELTVPMVAALVLVSGTASVASMAAHQSFLPRLVPMSLLPSANSRIEQSMTAAESVGPLLAGSLVRFLSAPVAILVNGVTYAVSAVMVSLIRVQEPAPVRGPDRHIGRELSEGFRWVYRHRTLAPYAIALHTWFFFNSSVMTIFVFYASQEIGLDPVSIGLVLAASGISGVLAAGLTPRLAERFGLGRICVLADWLTPVAFLIALVAPVGPRGVLVLLAGQLVYGVANGLKGPLEGSYRNAVTPDRLRARMNATIRSFNWGTITVSAPLAGWFASAYGNRPAIAVAIGGLVVAALILTLSPFRSVVMPSDEPDEPEA
ncbi:MFS transporter [Ornithinicoccus hortensis]|uniref:Na+/melibiose symporter-like transporter n=1 Tax=Ornithinicoccus hortensis TaxID=82346 RepID=A0A542YMG4_9MICO|nr:MFS transporter [Ornithinicoccus hortensis]TQL49277.1 Na+/melibiose symporter-like transporter [Ornithinicoccus hortensis]